MRVWNLTFYLGQDELWRRDLTVLFLTQIANEDPSLFLPLLKQKTAVHSIWKSASDLVLSYLIPTGFYVFHKWLKRSSQLEIAIKSSINPWLAPASGSSLDPLPSPEVKAGWPAEGKQGPGSPQEESPRPVSSPRSPPATEEYVVPLLNHSPCYGPSKFLYISEPSFLYLLNEESSYLPHLGQCLGHSTDSFLLLWIIHLIHNENNERLLRDRDRHFPYLVSFCPQNSPRREVFSFHFMEGKNWSFANVSNGPRDCPLINSETGAVLTKVCILSGKQQNPVWRTHCAFWMLGIQARPDKALIPADYTCHLP